MADWVQTIISACAAIGAISAALVTWWVYRDSRKPDVQVFFEADTDRSVVMLAVENFGEGVAYNVSIDGFDFSSMPKNDFTKKAKESFVSRGIPMLVPHARRETVIGENVTLDICLGDKTIDVDVRFDGKTVTGSMKGYVNRCHLDISSFRGSMHANSLLYTIAKAQAEMAGISM